MLYSIYDFLLIPWLFTAIIAFILLFTVTAPYGRFSNSSWGYLVNYRLGWFLQEIISPLSFSFFFFNGSAEKTIVSWVLFFIWVLHYINRSIIFPMRIPNGSKIPIPVIASAIFFNIINGFINGFYLGNLAAFDDQYIFSLKFIMGMLIFIIGLIINLHSDEILIQIKKKKAGYQIPEGGLYKFISCPNYFGEIMEWVGFAIISWSFPGLLFAIWTMANLIPRAKSHHKWYLEKFESNYPNDKKIIFPFIY